jgi:tRNA isopentenyl-2-thiomethyl-A-37 hydroxylase MiaE
VSAIESRPSEARETVAGFLAAAAMFVSAIGVAHRPARLIPVAVVLALVSARMTERHSRLAGWAVATTVVCWTVGMTIAVITEHPLY